MSSPPVTPPVDVDIVGTVGLVLAGLAGESDAARRLGLDHGDLQSLLGELDIARAAMIPVAIDDELASHYADLGTNAFDAPLFDDVIEGHRASGAKAFGFRLPADAVLGAAAMSLGCGPGGLMFHVGRCGSTLLCNLLASAGGWVALREPEFLNKLLRRLAAARDRAGKDRLGVLIAQSLRSLAHGVRLDAERRERACVVKLSSWNAIFADDLVSRFDATPLVVVTRDPCATVASFLRDPPHWHDDRSEGRDRMKAARLFAAVWSRTIDAALRLPSQRTLFIDYAELVVEPSTVLLSLCRHLGDSRTNPNVKAIANVMANYSKGPRRERFEPDGSHRPQGLEEAERELVAAITAASRSALAGRRSRDSR
jgi:hypothetical protein